MMNPTPFIAFLNFLSFLFIVSATASFSKEYREETIKSFEEESSEIKSSGDDSACRDYQNALTALRAEAGLLIDYRRIFSWHAPDYAYVYYKLNGERLGNSRNGYILCLEKQFKNHRLDSAKIQSACPICTLILSREFIDIRINPAVGKKWLPSKTKKFLLADWAWMRKASEMVEHRSFPSGLDSLLVWMESSAPINPSCGYMSPYQDYKCLERWRPEIKNLVLQIQPALPHDDPNFFRFVSYYKKYGKNQAFKDSLLILRKKMKNEPILKMMLEPRQFLTVTP